ncbi:ABC transporter permease [Leucobacter viscericola]|uniref:Spermidine/putrescine transport system permease protein PotC n=1 Tax=Leucobacter viscericola TaxID=2714935 RepID=A0A6G7XBR5_9MICO|nr:ABC transporter permease [Leucobacter viscericola]QIK61847.1 ABC transporter permease [Leucobacter viscericola]
MTYTDATKPVNAVSRRDRKPSRALRLRDFPGVGPISIFALIFLYVPIIITTIYAFNDGSSALVWKGFSFRWFGEVAQNANLMSSVWVSLQIAIVATVVATVFSILFALSVERLRRQGSAIATAILTAPLVIPEIVLAVATLGFIRMIGLQPGMFALILAHTSFCIPFALMPIRARLKGLGNTYFEAATDLGATNLQVFRRITLPLLVPGIISGAILAFVISLDDFIISNFLSAAGATPLPVFLFSLIRRGASPAVNVVATMLLVLAIVVTTITFLQSQRRSNKHA